MPIKVTFTPPAYCPCAGSLRDVEVRPGAFDGVWEFTPRQFHDDRGVFLESYKADVLVDEVGQSFELKQMNISVSRAGTVRGIHFADVPPGQAKYVQCFSGRILDIVVDIRVGSPTFGAWEAIEIDDERRNAVFVAEGLGHGFCALSPSATIGYFCSEPFAPAREHGIHPLDPDLALPWPAGEIVLSPKDAAAPSFAEAQSTGLLPVYAACQAWRAGLAHP